MKNLTKNIEKTWMILLGFLITVTPALADSPIDNMIVGLRNAGFNLILLWLLTLAVVFGVLTHLKLPDSAATRGVISIVFSFLVLIACAGTQVAAFVSTLSSYAIAIGFGLIVLALFLGLTGTKSIQESIFSMHPKFFGAILIIIAILIFISAGGLNLFAVSFIVSSPLLITLFFMFVIVATVWTIFKDSEG